METRKRKKSFGSFLHVCCPLQNGTNATELCGEYAVTSMIQSCLEILWYVYGCPMLALPFLCAKLQALLQIVIITV